MLGAFGVISEIQRAKFGVFVTYIFGGNDLGLLLEFQRQNLGPSPPTSLYGSTLLGPEPSLYFHDYERIWNKKPAQFCFRNIEQRKNWHYLTYFSMQSYNYFINRLLDVITRMESLITLIYMDVCCKPHVQSGTLIFNSWFKIRSKFVINRFKSVHVVKLHLEICSQYIIFKLSIVAFIVIESIFLGLLWWADYTTWFDVK